MRYFIIICTAVFLIIPNLSYAQSHRIYDYDSVTEYVDDVLLKEAESGDANAQYELGTLYENDVYDPYERDVIDFKKDLKKAQTWLRRAADQGHIRAQLRMGRLALPDNEAAFYWFHKAALQNNPDGQVNVGEMYLNGMGVSQNDVEGAKWIEKGALQGHPIGLYEYGMLLADGRGLEQDAPKALQAFNLAAKAGMPAAKTTLERIFETQEGVDMNPQMAYQWFSDGARNGHPNSLLQVGKMTAEGRGTLADLIIGHMWVSLAAEAGAPGSNDYLIKLEKLMSADNKIEAGARLARCKDLDNYSPTNITWCDSALIDGWMDKYIK
jgi:TPR repeat protein